LILARMADELFLEKVYETDMAEGLKAMALAGHGIAFLPHSAVAEAVEQKQLVRLDTPDGGEGRYSLNMEIRLYRDKLAPEGDPRQRQSIEDLWSTAVEFAVTEVDRTH
jgi:DNA-binding transcriptional LysR family regulator